ncbi:MAG: response regulator transcription factor [Bacteroidota bacterium]|nr:response regulator transcription factor [Bacteroidota bacterium]
MKILLVEDEVKIAAFIKKGLEEHDYYVDLAYDGLFGKKLAIGNIYDLIILDIILPNINGIELCKQIRDRDIKTPILMLTALGTPEDKVLGLDSGADDYLVKPFNFNELLARIRALSRRSPNIVINNILKIADLELDPESKIVKRSGNIIKLTVREFHLLELFMNNVGKVLGRNDIAEKVWDINFDTGTNVIDVYVNYLRNKIDKNYPNKLIHTVFGMGYVLKEEENNNNNNADT